ncbi:MAG: gliding motility-associated C-terminal domain-containing protein [Elusimicrobiota bacterium]
MEQAVNSLKRRGRVLLILAAALTGPLVYSGVYVSSRFHLFTPMSINSSGSSASPKFRNPVGVLGQNVYGSGRSAHYRNSGGVGSQNAVLTNPPAANLSDAYVYPNPFKPNRPGSYQASRLTFKHLPAEATIRIFDITGVQVAELRKTDRTVDSYEWNATNNDGQKLASGVYLFYMTAPDGGRARGKFSIIK